MDQQLAVRPMALASCFLEHSSDTNVLAMPQIGLNSPSRIRDMMSMYMFVDIPNTTLIIVIVMLIIAVKRC